MKIEVVCFREPGTQNEDWRVAVDHRVTSPNFQSKGAALAYAALLRSGYRRPEFAAWKTCYIIKEHRAIADLVALEQDYGPWVKTVPPAFLLTRINVPRQARGQGFGSELLKMILADADATGATLFTEPTPSDGLSRTQLVRWYMRHGFILGNYILNSRGR